MYEEKYEEEQEGSASKEDTRRLRRRLIEISMNMVRGALVPVKTSFWCAQKYTSQGNPRAPLPFFLDFALAKTQRERVMDMDARDT